MQCDKILIVAGIVLVSGLFLRRVECCIHLSEHGISITTRHECRVRNHPRHLGEAVALRHLHDGNGIERYRRFGLNAIKHGLELLQRGATYESSGKAFEQWCGYVAG